MAVFNYLIKGKIQPRFVLGKFKTVQEVLKDENYTGRN